MGTVATIIKVGRRQMQSEPSAAFAVERTVLPDGAVRVAVAGRIDEDASCDLLDCIVSGMVPGGRLIVDLTAATEVEETGIAALVLADRLARLHEATLEVVNCDGDPRRWPADPPSPTPGGFGAPAPR